MAGKSERSWGRFAVGLLTSIVLLSVCAGLLWALAHDDTADASGRRAGGLLVALSGGAGVIAALRAFSKMPGVDD
jgi:hypothetical protein